MPRGEIGEGKIVIHRIVGIDAGGGFVMQGDHNPAPDPWTPRGADIVGRAWVQLPLLGALVVWVAQPVIAAALIASAVASYVAGHPGRAAVRSRAMRHSA